MSDHENEEARDNNWFVHSAARPLRPMNVFVEITRNGCKCQESFGSSESKRPKKKRPTKSDIVLLEHLTSVKGKPMASIMQTSYSSNKIPTITMNNRATNTRTPLKRWRVIKRNEAHHANGCCCTIIDFTTWTRVSKSVLIKAIATCVSASNAERKGLCVDESVIHTALEDSRRTSLP
ncbi:hypothetical protein V1478_005962 [Vespula squamosa]|uniref:Uncharacterized protein n=1 Tax=Vespula squamosa TaxID=30214 RepID=A0ABD2B8V9_VESSQ